MNATTTHAALLVLIAGSGLLVAGCATASQPAAMTPAAVNITQRHAQAVAVKVIGGSATTATGMSKISNEDFEAALRRAIEQSRVFAEVTEAASAPYQLDVVITRLGQPFFGASLTVTLETNWSLRRRGDAAPVWEKGITSTYTAKAGEAFAGVTRLRLANEGAARLNIEEAIREMSRLKLE
jgi:hypothetical protein